MRLLIHDLDNYEFKNLSDDIKIIDKNGEIKNCIGCFGCWVKTPAECVINDSYKNIGEHFSKSDEIIIISKCVYGGFSPFVKNVLDRAISYIHPYFKIRNNEMHHKRRYDNVIKLTAWFYGEDVTSEEKETANNLLKANAVNYDGFVEQVTFVNSIAELEGKIV